MNSSQDKNLTWEERKKKWRERIKSISIPDNPTDQTIYDLEAKIDKFYELGSYWHNHYETLFDNIEELIDSVKEANMDQGNNKDERKANAVEAVRSYTPKDPDFDGPINLLERKKTIRERYNFFDNYVMKNLKSKANRLITVLGAVQLEADIQNRRGAK